MLSERTETEAIEIRYVTLCETVHFRYVREPTHRGAEWCQCRRCIRGDL